MIVYLTIPIATSLILWILERLCPERLFGPNGVHSVGLSTNWMRDSLKLFFGVRFLRFSQPHFIIFSWSEGQWAVLILQRGVHELSQKRSLQILRCLVPVVVNVFKMILDSCGKLGQFLESFFDGNLRLSLGMGFQDLKNFGEIFLTQHSFMRLIEMVYERLISFNEFVGEFRRVDRGF